MTQINENLKLGDAKVFFPRSRSIFKRYGIQDAAVEQVTLRRACELYNIDVDTFMSEICDEDEADLFRVKGRNGNPPKQLA